MNAIHQPDTLTAYQFWQWFQIYAANSLCSDTMEADTKNFLRSEFLAELHLYCESLDFEIVTSPVGRNQLIITANGDDTLFNAIDVLCKVAPDLPYWTVVPLRQSVCTHFIKEYAGLCLDTKEIWFLPLSPEQKERLEIKVCVKDYQLFSDHYAFTEILNSVISRIVGERSFALDIDHVFTDSLPAQPNNYGLWPILELTEYIDWFHSKRP